MFDTRANLAFHHQPGPTVYPRTPCAYDCLTALTRLSVALWSRACYYHFLRLIFYYLQASLRRKEGQGFPDWLLPLTTCKRLSQAPSLRDSCPLKLFSHISPSGCAILSVHQLSNHLSISLAVGGKGTINSECRPLCDNSFGVVRHTTVRSYG